jgi:hypothetical protein
MCLDLWRGMEVQLDYTALHLCVLSNTGCSQMRDGYSADASGTSSLRWGLLVCAEDQGPSTSRASDTRKHRIGCRDSSRGRGHFQNHHSKLDGILDRVQPG